MKINTFVCFIITYLFISLNSDCEAQSITEIPDKQTLQTTLDKVADWQVNHFTYSKVGSAGYLHDFGIDAWTNATLYLGLAEWAAMLDDGKKYYTWLTQIGDENDWQIPSNFKDMPKYKLYHADELCIGQFYLNMYSVFKKKEMMEATINRVNWIMSNPPNSILTNGSKQAWTWCDALFMAPPVYAQLAQLTGNDDYLLFMDKQFKLTYNYLYDKENKLFFRDDRFFDQRENNGKKVFWGRGNGWVAAGLVNILKTLPTDSKLRPFYENLFSELVGSLVALQSDNGFWHASLLDPKEYPSPETSATALIAYALAYGINADLLNRSDYLPSLEKAWSALSSAVSEDGKLGWVQPIGADPKQVTEDMTAVYGVGAFLLAGTEVYKLAQ
ncbi:glycoside hydrolase family 105 protein [Dysgonomonas sp. GY617]|uniref:glycoside hydrolase family 88/105 protein n=1 Tax=Dysgonomonas sp. GY617 TaxID=2780420 RepID=UPI0018834AF8|nr:glycoside hydrolase family 88 protein [Dysgonomonas sp. GY617]MBF0574668.1 glycoside hydrolase family 88 protein [Dysgonomonas sp. GY617]